MTRLAGKTAYVTGSGRGIGRAVALKLAREGAQVVVNDLEAEPAQEAVEAIKAAGGKAIAVVGSVTDPAFPEQFISAGLDVFGGIDIIVNNAGYTWDAMIHKMSDEQFEAMLDVHLKAPFRILRAAAGPIRERAAKEAEEGREVFRKIVNISSISGTKGNIGQANYSSAKAGVIGLTKTLAREWGRHKVNVNCVAFGFIETRMTAASDEKQVMTVDGNTVGMGIPTKIVEGVRASIPLGRAGTPEEAANGVYLFCTPEADYITGQVVTVDGGMAI